LQRTRYELTLRIPQKGVPGGVDIIGSNKGGGLQVIKAFAHMRWVKVLGNIEGKTFSISIRKGGYISSGRGQQRSGGEE